MKSLLIGSGRDHTRKIGGKIADSVFKMQGHNAFGLELWDHHDWDELVTLDHLERHSPDVVWDLEKMPYPFPDNEFDEIHAYDVLEHTGNQGDVDFFFAQFSELWRILKPGGVLCGICPRHDSIWAWGDPSHKRVLTFGSMTFLSQEAYKQVGETAMSDFRDIYSADLRSRILAGYDEHRWFFVLEAVKP